MNDAGYFVWMGIVDLEIACKTEDAIRDFRTRLSLAEESLRAGLEVLSMRNQYYRDIVKNFAEEKRKVSFLVKKVYDEVHCSSYCTAQVQI